MTATGKLAKTEVNVQGLMNDSEAMRKIVQEEVQRMITCFMSISPITISFSFPKNHTGAWGYTRCMYSPMGSWSSGFCIGQHQRDAQDRNPIRVYL